MTPKPRPPRLSLPFVPRKVDAGEWAYDHRVGLCVTVIFFLVLGIAMVSARIIIGARPVSEGIYIELVDPTPLPDEQRREQLDERSDDDFRDAQNRVSNENAAADQARSTARTRALQRQIADEQAALAERMAGNRRALERGRAEEAAINERRNAQTDDAAQNTDAKVADTVLVSFSLSSPLRTSVNLVVPGYRCRGGGEVEIEITVDRSGRVTSAAVSRGSRSVDACMTDAALAAARISRFNLDPSAPERHRGTITYLFVPQ